MNSTQKQSLTLSISKSFKEGNEKVLKCLKHSKSFEFLCYQCNELLCSRCFNLHLRENQNHICDHIDDITNSIQYLNFSNIDNSITSNDNDNNNSNSQFNNEIKEIWNSIKKSSEEMEYLHSKENEISDSFRELQELLVEEEQRLKKIATKDLTNIKDRINRDIGNLKKIINIANIYNNCNINNDKKRKFDSNEKEDNNENQINNSNSVIEESLENTTDNYSTEFIIKSIKESTSIQEFIDKNKNTIFHTNQSVIDHHKHANKNDIDTIVFDFIKQYNNNNNNKPNAETIHKLQFTIEIKATVSNILEKLQHHQQSLNTLKNQAEIIFSAHSSGVTLFDVTNNTILKDISIEYNFYNTFTSIVRVSDEHIYIFSPVDNNNQFCIYNTKNSKCELEAFIGLSRNVSACYDGQGHIYLAGGYNTRGIFSKTIYRYDIETKHYETFHTNLFLLISSSFFYKNKLYLVSRNKPCIFQFNPSYNQVSEIFNDLLPISKASCHLNGNIYLLSDENDGKFIKFNIDTRQIQILTPLNICFDDCISMVYCKNNNNPKIILFGGKTIGNHTYNIDKNLWEKSFESDNCNRTLCGSINLSN